MSSPPEAVTEAVTEAEAATIGREAYLFLYPLLLMEFTRRVMTNVPPEVRIGAGPMNTFSHARVFPPADFRDVVRPNFDTLYSVAWLDLRSGPLIVSAPDTGGRYYLLPMLDMWSNVFAVPGKRTTGTGAAHFAVVPRGWQGTLPPGVEPIEAPSPYVWVIGRTQTNGASDYPAVHAIQDGYRITPLSRWGQPPEPVPVPIDPSVDMNTPPMQQVERLPAEDFFRIGAELMGLHPPQSTDWSQLARFRRVGLVPGQPFSLSAAPAAVRTGLERAVAETPPAMRAKSASLARVVNGWQMNVTTMGVYGNDYLKRAVVALVGLGANQPEDAIYPLNVADADGQPVRGEFAYVLHFPAGQLPPVDAFWSLTLYDAEGFQVANPLNRFAIGDRDPLRANPDGSLDLFIQNQDPGGERTANWLPAPAQGTISLTLRLYAPRPEALDGRWNPPPVKRVSPEGGTVAP
ncbi:DUF1254 domain-containing protein [Cyanobium sp. FGCU-52]|nr:DUF1254 domain-containing protein [Cyanobium sp. FGCU52]